MHQRQYLPSFFSVNKKEESLCLSAVNVAVRLKSHPPSQLIPRAVPLFITEDSRPLLLPNQPRHDWTCPAWDSDLPIPLRCRHHPQWTIHLLCLLRWLFNMHSRACAGDLSPMTPPWNERHWWYHWESKKNTHTHTLFLSFQTKMWPVCISLLFSL